MHYPRRKSKNIVVYPRANALVVDYCASHSKTFALISASVLALFVVYAQMRHKKKNKSTHARLHLAKVFSFSLLVVAGVGFGSTITSEGIEMLAFLGRAQLYAVYGIRS